MSVIEKAVQWAVNIAEDNTHGYSQQTRWGPSYDCSSLVISAFRQAGLELQSTYTGNMKADFLAHGFKAHSTSEPLKRGDVLLNEASHTALYIGNGQIVHARYQKARLRPLTAAAMRYGYRHISTIRGT